LYGKSKQMPSEPPSVGPVTALRETSIMFAALIGMTFLGEWPTAPKVRSTVIVMLGAAAAIALAR
jgi:uncharacterized membrane protein